jgi:hypothetical protein
MNYFVDGFAVLQRMADETPDLFDALTDTRYVSRMTEAMLALLSARVPIVNSRPEYRNPGDGPLSRSFASSPSGFQSRAGILQHRVPQQRWMSFQARRRSELVHRSQNGIA